MGYIERFRRRLAGTDPEDAEYVCTGCNARFEKRRQVCPECGGYAIRRREWRPIRE